MRTLVNARHAFYIFSAATVSLDFSLLFRLVCKYDRHDHWIWIAPMWYIAKR